MGDIMRIKNLIAIVSVVSLLFVGCATTSKVEKSSVEKSILQNKASAKVKKLLLKGGFDVVDTNYIKSNKNNIVLVDARPFKKYKGGHIPSAYSIPDKKFDKCYYQIDSLDKTKEIITYCGGWKCGKSPKVALFLKKKGWKNIKVYQEGMPSWKKSGQKVEKIAKKSKKTITNKNYVVVNGVQLVKDQEENAGMVYGAYFKKVLAGDIANMVIVDVRDKEDFAQGHIKNAINISFEDMKPNEFVSRLSKIINNGKKIILVCSSGARATEAMMVVQENKGDLKNTFFADAMIHCDKNSKCKIKINDPL
jgi:rhodanese-related sulfurtransferase